MKRSAIFAAAVLTAILIAGSAPAARASAIEDLRKSIEERARLIERLNEEAKQFRQALQAEQEAGKTLKDEIGRVNRDIERIRRDVAITEQKTERVRNEIDLLGLEIKGRELNIQTLRADLGAALQAVSERGRESLIESFLKHATLAAFFRETESLASLQQKVLDTIKALNDLRALLGTQKAQAEEKHEELEDLQRSLGDRKKIREAVRQDKNALLVQTKNQEKKYQELLAERERQREALEAEVRQIEEEIRITIDPSTLPVRRPGVLGFPLPDATIESCWKNNGADNKNCITQFFGNTDFARRGAYDGKGHNGVDLRADVGTPVLAAEAGTVESTGDTDQGCRGASYGKWILIRHPNNLSTLYAHLSAVSVSPGQEVERGSRIGFSGRSGYATGPHLHFTVFATQAVEIRSIRSKVCGRMMTLPIAALNGYLNPLDYL